MNLKSTVHSVASKAPKKRTLLIAGAVAAILLVLVISAAAYQKHMENQEKAASMAQVEATRLDKARTDRENATNAKLAATQADNKALCGLFDSYTKNKNTQRFVVKPAQYCD